MPTGSWTSAKAKKKALVRRPSWPGVSAIAPTRLGASTAFTARSSDDR
jgi:hypothetical protein